MTETSCSMARDFEKHEHMISTNYRTSGCSAAENLQWTRLYAQAATSLQHLHSPIDLVRVRADERKTVSADKRCERSVRSE